ncbi:Trehalose synthase-like protein [Rubrobacter xylanophilus DSM 9941]|uniref:Maltokinase n=1 Tax=Rubrobacter xylanophilus (strain DSM 9941 / JCM 11954 / NBRC 16129 / PRD-1) TaxID=266117 RepID=Q1AZ87_RUBXD|nr:maltose alpha-D-glucosyltransferase [Rubrobacter xylanophilus]ABG03291.1 Trehalose synthase-like protein [Rubrobacter xylanophilus DSM 9941]
MTQTARRGAARREEAYREDPLWYKDAIIYQLHVKAFFDSDNDGIGDFRGLTQRLEYIKDLGVNAIWLMPFYPSPMRDDGYDISEYKNVHPEYGTRRDFRNFVRRAHALGLKVITELVINHTSDAHPWFQRARKAPRNSVWRNFYVWSDTDKKYADARIIFTDTETSNWTWDPVAQQYYWHRFFSHQPDLNHDNPRVFDAIMRVMRFWLDAGVDGLRLDAIPYLIEREGTDCENLPETHEILRRMRAELDARYQNRIFLAEANQWPEDVLPYFGKGDECHMAFHFPLMPRIYMAVAQEDRHPIVEIMQQTPEIPEVCQWAIFLRNHDELTLEMVTDRERDYMYQTYAADPRARINLGIRRRLAPLMENDRARIELLNSLLMSMPGTPIIYYGDEIGMGDNVFLGDRNAVRTPMQWTSDRNAGFSRADPHSLYLPPIMDPVYGYEALNVEAQSRSPGSLLNWMKRIIAVRKAHKAFGRGTLEFLHPGNRKVLAYLREYGDETILCVANLSRSAQPVELDLSRFSGRVPVEMIGGSSFPPIGSLPYFLTLPGHSFYWFNLTTEAEAPSWHQESPRFFEPPVVVLPAGRQTARDIRRLPLRLQHRQVAQLEQEALPAFLSVRRWFAAKGSEIERVSLLARAEFGPDRLLALLRVGAGGAEHTYFLPLAAAWEDEDGERVSGLMPHALAKIRRRYRVGVLFDALADEGFCREVVAAMAGGRELEMGEGRVRFYATGALEELLAGEPVGELAVRRASVEQSNTSVILGERLVLKAYRRLQPGVNPELEIGRYLTEVRRFPNTPPLAGAVEYEDPRSGTVSLALLQGFVPSQGDGWSYVLGYLDRYLERRLLSASWSPEEEGPAEPPGQEGQEADEGFFMELMRTLGVRTGELHAALAAPTDDPSFSPEPAPPAEVSRWVEAVLDDLRLTLSLLERRRSGLPEEVRPEVDRLLRMEARAFDRLEAISARGIRAVKTRHHGDYHLGQVLVAGNDFQIIDFEGEPARTLEERRRKHSPLRDVAGMLRSFDYAAQTALMNLGADRAVGEDPEPVVRRWERSVREAFLGGYAEGVRGAGVLPGEGEEAAALVELFALEKALYEIRYELDNRPDWIGIPVRGVLDLLTREESP